MHFLLRTSLFKFTALPIKQNVPAPFEKVILGNHGLPTFSMHELRHVLMRSSEGAECTTQKLAFRQVLNMQTKKAPTSANRGGTPCILEYMLLRCIHGLYYFLFSTKETFGPPQRAKDINSRLDRAGILATTGI